MELNKIISKSRVFLEVLKDALSCNRNYVVMKIIDPRASQANQLWMNSKTGEFIHIEELPRVRKKTWIKTNRACNPESDEVA